MRMTFRAIGMWFLSMGPMFFLIVVINYPWPIVFGVEHNIDYLSVIGIIGIFMSALAFGYLRWLAKGSASGRVCFTEVEDRSFDNVSFLVSGLLPLMSLNLPQRSPLGLLLILGILCIVMVRSETYYANPTLALFGYRVYAVSMTGKANQTTTCFVLSTTPIFPETDGRVIFISRNVGLFRDLRTNK